MKWIDQLVNDAKKKAANAAVARIDKAVRKYQGWLEQLPKEWTTHDLMKVAGLDQPNAREAAKRMQMHGLIYPARHMTLYARHPVGKEKPVKEAVARVSMMESRQKEWMDDLPDDVDFTVGQAQMVWALGYDSARYRIRTLTEAGKLENVKWGTYRKAKGD